ncbi:putative HVA22-like protein g [Hordeum vulgare]|uniref:HVA22-like protein n=2 Tax=Hordeum vulgare subsp. vulgare TaxID=112509 RepID=A0A8I7B338_HORVV|nr:putative HVA22-like protein g isoform X1 [Hordeum vulgare subsp. vulgare]KAE8798249.1 putative HVA22-like protein g [Hordeum vulgare]
MSVELLTKFLTVLFGYAMPALECFKAIEQRTGRTDQLRFWCQYWIILVILVIFDEIAGALISRIPMYYEVKLAFLVYLWYPQTRGSDIVYENFVRPLVMQYEPNIEERLRYLRANAGDLIVFYLKNFTDRGYELFLRVLDFAQLQASTGSRTRRFFSFRGDRTERPSFVDDDYVHGSDRRSAARQRRPRGGDY